MKIPRIAHALSNINEEYLAQSEQTSKHQINKRKIAAIAACTVIVLSGAVTAILHFAYSDMLNTEKYTVILNEASAHEWRWEDKTDYEKFPVVKFNSNEYRARANCVSEALIENNLGSCTAENNDIYTNTDYTDEFEVYKITDISEQYLIAVKMNGVYYVYIKSDNNDFPQNFTELLNGTGLEKHLGFSRFSVKEKNGNDENYHKLTNEADIWTYLSKCDGATLVTEDYDYYDAEKTVSFTATSEPLGIYKKSFKITSDGYVWTNIFDYAVVYDIGEKQALEIIEYALSNSTETDFEPYELYFSGTVTEINDKYIVVDDSVLKYNKKDGVSVKIYLDNLRIRRAVKYEELNVGDIVSVTYADDIENNEIFGAYDIAKGKLVGSHVMTAE